MQSPAIRIKGRCLPILFAIGVFILTQSSLARAQTSEPKPKKKQKQQAGGATSKPSKKRPARWIKDNTAGLRWQPGRKPVQLWPPPDSENRRPQGDPIILGNWSYRTVRAASPQNGVPWELIVTPAGEDREKWLGGEAVESFRRFDARRGRPGELRSERDIPVIELPEAAWRQRMDADLQGVVGIHYHEFVSNDVARILYTVHKVPADDPEGAPPSEYEGKRGSRIEATLLTPVAWSLDQCIVVRVDNELTPDKALREQQTLYRINHEKGHAEVSQAVLLDVLKGPQTWSLQYCEGRQSRLEYFWKRELIGRAWDGYRGGGDKIATLRTTIAVVPPTRWSLLLPIPPGRVTQKHLQQFNDAITQLGPQFTAADKAAQDEFHSHHGEFDSPAEP